MSVPTINALPPAPNPTSSPATFDSDVTNFLGALPTMVGQTNTLAEYLEGRATDAQNAASAASGSADTANARANAAAASASAAQTARNSAQSAAAAAQSSAGLPAITGKPGHYLAVNLAGTGVEWVRNGIDGVEIEVYDTAGTHTFTKLPSDRFYLVRVWGGGAGGGRGSTYGGGGSGGMYVERLIPAAEVDSSVTVTVGAGGAGATANAHGNNGEASSFGAYVEALGGNRGRNDQRFASPAGARTDNAPTSSASAFLYNTWPYGGYGAARAGYTGGDSIFGGAGGGGTTNTSGTDGGVSQYGGDGGAGGVSNGSGGDGTAPGGGGGGCRAASGASAGNGAPGRVEVIRIQG